MGRVLASRLGQRAEEWEGVEVGPLQEYLMREVLERGRQHVRRVSRDGDHRHDRGWAERL